jgi:hypothetical protein
MSLKELGMSRQCAYRWVARFDAEGDAGLLDRSCRPHHNPTRTPARTERRVLVARRRLRRGPAGLSHATGVPAATCGRILHRHGVPRLAECDPLTGNREIEQFYAAQTWVSTANDGVSLA